MDAVIINVIIVGKMVLKWLNILEWLIFVLKLLKYVVHTLATGYRYLYFLVVPCHDIDLNCGQRCRSSAGFHCSMP